MILHQKLLISVVWTIGTLSVKLKQRFRTLIFVSPTSLPLELKYSMPSQSLLKYGDMVNILLILFSLIGSREKKKSLDRNLHNAGTRNRLVRR